MAGGQRAAGQPLAGLQSWQLQARAASLEGLCLNSPLVL